MADQDRFPAFLLAETGHAPQLPVNSEIVGFPCFVPVEPSLWARAGIVRVVSTGGSE